MKKKKSVEFSTLGLDWGLFEKKYFFPLKKLEFYLFQIYYREGGCTKLKKIFFAFLDKLSHFQQVLKSEENQRSILNSGVDPRLIKLNDWD